MPKYTLVDWYGNRQTFDRDTIYAEGEDGGLVPFTQGAGNPVIEPLNVTQNGVYTTPVGVNGFSPVSVNVPDLPPVLQSKEATQNGEYTPDSGYDGLSKVTVNVPAPEIKLQEKTITENGEYTADAGFDGLAKVLVAVASSGASPKYARRTFTATGTWNERVALNFGFKPDFLIIYPDKTVTIGSSNFLFMGPSQKFKDATGGGTVFFSYISSGTLWTDTSSTVIDSTNTNSPINKADETGFNFGKSHASGTFWAIAIGL